MHTRMTELFGIKHPVLLSGMSWVSVPELVAAVSNAGGLGILATGHLGASETRNQVRRVRELTDKPFGANTTLLFPGASQNAKVLLEEEVPVINSSLGKGDWIVREAGKYGGKVIATVTNTRHARRAQEYGCDAIIATGNEAAAHGGPVTTFCLVPTLASAVRIPVIAAGGIADGRGLAAALALGAEGVAMGTRMMSTQESPLHSSVKELVAQKVAEDTFYTRKFDGMGSRLLDTPGARKAAKHGLTPVACLRALATSRELAEHLAIPYADMLKDAVGSGWRRALDLALFAKAFPKLQVAINHGDLDTGALPAGQAVGLVKDIPSVAEVVAIMVEQAEEIIAGLEAKVLNSPSRLAPEQERAWVVRGETARRDVP